ncbi:MAG TPA: hypothetical protein VF477_06610 [Mycobacterium sp.]
MEHDHVDEALVHVAARVARLAFPHDVPDEVYEMAATDALTQDHDDPREDLKIRRSLQRLTEFLDDDAQLLASLKDLSDEAWFRTYRQLIIPGIYGHPAVWARLGYQGPSHHLGGYLHRGFNDLTWLPDPRVEEFPEPLAEIGPDSRSADGVSR